MFYIAGVNIDDSIHKRDTSIQPLTSKRLLNKSPYLVNKLPASLPSTSFKLLVLEKVIIIIIDTKHIFYSILES